jgi:Flp pilus assembly protein TadG
VRAPPAADGDLTGVEAATPPPPAGAEMGAIGLWLLGLCVMLLFLGGLSLDLWRAFSERRALAGVVDAAAIAGASGVDITALHTIGTVRLDPDTAVKLARASLASQTGAGPLEDARVEATPQAVTVRASARVELTLLRILEVDGPLLIAVTATSGPRTAEPLAP